MVDPKNNISRIVALPQSSILDSRFLVMAIKIAHIIWWIVLQPVVRLGVKKTILLKKSELPKHGGLIVSSNHQSRFDHFVILASLPFGMFVRLLPLRYFVYNALFSIPVLLPGLLVNGCFPAYKHYRYPYGLAAAERFLNRDQSIFIFPEGKRARYHTAPARTGISILAATTGTPLLPINIRWNRRGAWNGCSIIIGNIHHVKGKTAQEILDISYDLRK